MQIKTSAAIAFFGSVTELASKLDIKSQAVSQWGEFVPARRVYEIHFLSGGQLPQEQDADRELTNRAGGTTEPEATV